MFTEESEGEWMIPVQVREARSSCYIAPPSLSESLFSSPYVRDLHQLFLFDFSHSGWTKLFVPAPEREEEWASTFSAEQWLDLAWHDWKVDYLVIPQIRGQVLSLLSLDVAQRKTQEVHSVALSGQIDQDAALLHQMTDTLIEQWGGIGIATTSILYVNRTLNQGERKNSSEIWEIDYDGRNPRQLTYEGSLSVNPHYFPPQSGKRSHSFFYVSYKLGQPKIYHSSRRSLRTRRFSYLRGNQFMPVVSRDQRQIAFISDVSGNPDIFLVDFSPEQGAFGKPIQLFTAPRSTQSSPTFSPDGKQIAFVSNKEGTPRIYLLNVPEWKERREEREVTLISKKHRENSNPCWSPDGKKIAYSALQGSYRQIWLYDCESGKEEALTSGPLHKEGPSWAPNSLSLVYNGIFSDTESELYLIDIYERVPQKISSGKGTKLFACWEPLIS